MSQKIPDILQQIVATKKQEVVSGKVRESIATLKSRCSDLPPTRPFINSLTVNNGSTKIIAEVKKASPSAGIIKNAAFDPVSIAHAYETAGANALSVLTDEQYFQGKLEYIAQIKAKVSLPILRKDFMIDPYQIYEARVAGADAILLIAEILNPHEIIELQQLATSLQLGVLIEVHELDSLLKVRDALKFPIPAGCLLGINNRDLRTFTVDLATTNQLARYIENKSILVGESGIRNRNDVQQLQSSGVNILLIGETLMRAGNIAQTMAELKGTSATL